ncbi:MurR/RpiR family transcriptional regulator [Streptomyces sp. SID12488]|uniref:MurR/RpiR family transcriptional regulator n=1 Tax=Streptomyces sp. SID12488 TaxID=2706040 RepID=UPI0013DA88CA|nr:MurR/RpiR family transcriptional regulator [Streptomyces sp. SID12488]NEA65195.1 MurR/RpiR family transcriptional regulator [Streptomyces sp. SID12488]
MSDGAGTDATARAGSSARLNQLFEGRRLTPTQRRIAHCLVRRAADVPFLSSGEPAHLAGASQPSVTRFAVALGFDGYPVLHRHLREVVPAGTEAEEQSTNPYQNVSAPMLLGQVLLEAMCDALPDAQAHSEEFDARAAARGLFVE